MKKEDLMAGVGEIDGKIVDETGKKREAIGKRRKMKVLFSVIAAALVLSIIGTVVLVMNVTKPSREAEIAAGDPETMEATPTGAVETREAGVPKDDAFDVSFYSKTAEYGAGEEAEIADAEPSVSPSDVAADVSGYSTELKGKADGADPAAPGDAVGDGAPVKQTIDPDAFILTAAEWRDLDNWAFFMNLVNSEKIAFPAYGVDPRCRVSVTVTDEEGDPLGGEKVTLCDADGEVLFSAVTGKDGKAYLFWGEGQTPATVASGDASAPVVLKADTSGTQGKTLAAATEDVILTKAPEAQARTALQVSFIVDTTGSMGDELAYLQKDFASIADEVGTDGVSYSVNFYRDEGDEYVTKCNPFSGDIDAVKALLNDEYCAGGGDTPEAVDQILKEAITDNEEWADGCEKIAFLIFDASPHVGTEETIDEAIRSAAERGIRLIPVVASGSERDTELFGRAIAAVTGGTYVFLTDDSGVGGSHLEPIVGDYEVELLHDVIVRIINEHKAG